MQQSHKLNSMEFACQESILDSKCEIWASMYSPGLPHWNFLQSVLRLMQLYRGNAIETIVQVINIQIDWLAMHFVFYIQSKHKR